MITGTLSIITFHSKASKEVGCSIYLLVSSGMTICTMSVLTIKFLQLLLFQMALITNRSFLNFNCVTTDMILKVLFTSGEWLNACMAAERMLIVIKGIKGIKFLNFYYTSLRNVLFIRKITTFASSLIS